MFMKFLEVLYYYFYLFYDRVLPGGRFDIHFNVYSSVALCFVYIPAFLLKIIILKITCKPMNLILWMVPFFISMYFFNKYYNPKRVKKILKEKPKFFNNHKLTIYIAVFFFLFTLSFMFALGFVGKKILSNCG